MAEVRPTDNGGLWVGSDFVRPCRYSPMWVFMSLAKPEAGIRDLDGAQRPELFELLGSGISSKRDRLKSTVIL
jgi:hypothetical protein